MFIKKFYFMLPIILTLISIFKVSDNNVAILVNSSSSNWDNWYIESNENSYIKWVDFTPTYEVLAQTSKLLARLLLQ